MRLPFCLSCPILLFVLLGTSAEIPFDIDTFVDLILNIRKFYSAASVIFVHPGDIYEDYGDLYITYLVHTSCRLLNRRYIITMDVNYQNLDETLTYYHKMNQPIFVVILPDFEAYLEFADAIKTFAYPMFFPVWFILFLYTPDNSTHDYCREPIGNPFNLTFDTQMLVLCNNEIILREWYSVKDDTIKIFDLAELKDDKGFVLLTNLTLYERRKDMEGVVLRTVVMTESLVSKVDGNQMAALYEKVLEELKSSLNFTLEIVSRQTEYGMRDRQTFIWSGVFGEIVYNRADIIVSDVVLLGYRMHYVDFTLPLIISKLKLYIKEPECSVKWISYFQIFNLRTWTIIIMLIATAPLLTFFMKTYRYQSRSAADLICENFFCIWGIFCQQALIEFPKKLSLRIAYFTIFLTAMLIMTHYTAALIYFLTVCTRVLPFQTLDEFMDDGTYKLIMLRHGANYDMITFQAEFEASSYDIKLMKFMKKKSELPISALEGFMQVCNERNVVFMISSIIKKTLGKEIPCKLSSISTNKINNLGMALSKNNSYTHLINYHLQKLLTKGIIKRLKIDTNSPQIVDVIYKPFYLYDVIPILVILCGGFIISIIMLIIEKIHYRPKRRKFQSRVFYPSKKLFI